MARFFEDIATSFSQIIASIKEDFQQDLEPEAHRKRDVAIYTNAAFAQVDLVCVGLDWNASNDGGEEVPEAIQKQVLEGLEEIQIKLAGEIRSSDEAIARARDAAKLSEELSEKLKPALGLDSNHTSNSSISESNLNAIELLEESVRKCLNLLFSALVRQLDCCDGNHFVRLKLSGFINQFDHQSRSIFDLFLSSGHNCKRSRWVASRCTFAKSLSRREKRGCRVIQNSVLKNKTLSLLLEDAYHPEHQENQRNQDRQNDQGTVQLDRYRASNSSITPTVSLAELLKHSNTPQEIRRVANSDAFSVVDRDQLCLNLALSLLHLSSDDWGKLIWYSDEPDSDTGIFFLRDPGTQEIRDKTNAYISWRLHEESGPRDSKGLLCDPQLLDFAQLLMEIHCWKRLQVPLYEESEEISNQLSGKEQLRLRLLRYIDDNFRPSDFEFTSALKACLNEAGRKEAGDRSRPELTQTYVLQYIVQPLHRYLGNPMLPKSTIVTGSCLKQDGLINTNPLLTTTSLYDSRVNNDKPKDMSSYADEFWDNMKQFKEKYIETLEKKTIPARAWPKDKIRIAVIDSGVRSEDPEIIAAGTKKRIRGYRNFSSSNPNDWEDEVEDGHGTMVARLLLDVAPAAELYIAKVSRQKSIPKKELYLIAEAINWAVLYWDVDIITISIALSEKNYDIDEELNQALYPYHAKATGKIVFAAAGNKGANKPRAWPASKKGVIAIHATDGRGSAVNMNPNREGNVNLATLGRDIKMRWPSDDLGKFKDVYISGTSFSTPIVAGIAANILEFARHRLKLNQWRKDRFYSHDGMGKILKAMSGRRGDYDYVQPLTLFEEALSGDWGDRRNLVLTPGDPENICKVLHFIVGLS